MAEHSDVAQDENTAFPMTSASEEGGHTPISPTQYTGLVEDMHRAIHLNGTRWAAEQIIEIRTSLSTRLKELKAQFEAIAVLAGDARAENEILRARLKTVEGENEQMTKALEPFAEFAGASGFGMLPDDMPMTQGSRFARRQVTAGDFKRARAALHSKEAGQSALTAMNTDKDGADV